MTTYILWRSTALLGSEFICHVNHMTVQEVHTVHVRTHNSLCVNRTNVLTVEMYFDPASRLVDLQGTDSKERETN